MHFCAPREPGCIELKSRVYEFRLQSLWVVPVSVSPKGLTGFGGLNFANEHDLHIGAIAKGRLVPHVDESS